MILNLQLRIYFRYFACLLERGLITCATDLGTVRINASAYYPPFYQNNKEVGTSDYLRVIRLRRIWAEGTFAVLKREHKLNKIQKRGLQKAMEECLLSVMTLNLKRLVKVV
ncbi:MAG: transposase [Eubacteriales bacterium]|nr:transposase [Eubacteriales bacterium]